MRAAAVWALTVLALGATATAAQAATSSDSVLVKVDPGAGPQARAEVGAALDADARRPLMAGWAVYDLPGAVTLPQARDLLSDVPAADAVALDQRVKPLEVPDDTYWAQQWPLPTIDAPAGWDASVGAAPVTVAVIDTGVDTSQPDLAGRLWRNTGEIAANGIDDDGNGYVDDVGGWNFADWNTQLYSASDGDSHGTHVAGTIAARRGNAYGVAGIAANAVVMPLKFLKPGGGFTSDAITAIQYAVANGARVINASWGGTAFSQPLCDAIAQAGASGVLFVAAAGNDGTDNDSTGSWPANCPAPNLVSVAATTSTDGLASFSNYGASQVDVGAPGESVASTLPGGAFGYKSGTSMAAPHVTGIAAVVLGMHPGFTPGQLKTAVMSGGQTDPALAGLTVSGRRVDLLGALTVAAGGIGPDTTPPGPFGILSPAEGAATSLTVPIFRWTPASDADSGIAGYRLTVDGATMASVPAASTAASPAAPLSEGVHNWSVVAVDGQGNTRSAGTRTLIVDHTAPTVAAAQSPAAAARVAGPSVRLRWVAARDTGSGLAGYRLMVDGVATSSPAAGETTALVRFRTGRHTWQVVARDLAGNESTGPSRAIVVTSGGLTSTARGRLTLIRLAPAVRSGARARLKVRVDRSARVSFSVRRSSGGPTLASQARRVPVGVSTVVLSPALARRMAAPGVYVVTARAAGMRDSVRVAVRGRR